MSNILNIGKNEVKNQNWRDYLLYEPVVLKKFSVVYTTSFLVNCLVFSVFSNDDNIQKTRQ